MRGEDIFDTDESVADYNQSNSKHCNRCGQGGLHWKETARGWRLHEHNGRMHVCEERNKKVTESSIPTLVETMVSMLNTVGDTLGENGLVLAVGEQGTIPVILDRNTGAVLARLKSSIPWKGADY